MSNQEHFDEVSAYVEIKVYTQGDHHPASKVIPARDNRVEAKLGHFAKYKAYHPLRYSPS